MPKSMSKSEFPASIFLFSFFFSAKIVKMQWQCKAFALDHLLLSDEKKGQYSVVEEEH